VALDCLPTDDLDLDNRLVSLVLLESFISHTKLELSMTLIFSLTTVQILLILWWNAWFSLQLKNGVICQVY